MIDTQAGKERDSIMKMMPANRLFKFLPFKNIEIA